MPKRIMRDLEAGEVFGYFTVLMRVENFKSLHMYLCRCVCGTLVVKRSWHIVSSKRSCGCVDHRSKHGGWGTKEYRVWTSAKQRCDNPHLKNFKYYGARGITMCDRWRNSFADFMLDMGPRPAGMTLERKDNDGNYEPGNCVWATYAEQAANKRPHGTAKTREIAKDLCQNK